jgi:hypothetical protein
MTMALEYAIARQELDGLEGKRRFMLQELEYAERDSRPDQRAIVRQMIGNFNRQAGAACRPELRIDVDGLPRIWPRNSPTRTPTPSPRRAVSQQDPLIESLLYMWDSYRRGYFDGRLPDVTITMEARDGSCFGKYEPTAGRVWLNPAILAGTHRACRGGSGDRDGLLRHLADTLLHEAIHAHQFAITGRCSADPHDGAFHAQAYCICKRLDPIRRNWRDHLTVYNAQWFPEMVRPRSYFRGAITNLCRG